MSAPPPDESPDPSTPPSEPPDPALLGSSGGDGPRGPALVLLTAVVVAVLVAPVLVAVVHAASRPGGSEGSPGSARGDSTRTAAPSPSSADSSTAAPTAVPSPSSAAPSNRRQVTCWDGASARRVTACSEPAGVAGLGWVFPSIADQRCGSPTTAGRDGALLRLVCRARLDGGRAIIVYTQWGSTDAATAYLRSKGLRPAGGRATAKVRRFVRPAGPPKAGAVYAVEPFSYIATLPAGSDPSVAAGQVVQARPANQVRGARR